MILRVSKQALRCSQPDTFGAVATAPAFRASAMNTACVASCAKVRIAQPPPADAIYKPDMTLHDLRETGFYSRMGKLAQEVAVGGHAFTYIQQQPANPHMDFATCRLFIRA